MNISLGIRSTTHLVLLLGVLVGPSAAAQSGLVKTTVAYREVDGHKILADVYRPAGNKVCPVIVWIHGGALIMGHRGGIHPKVRALAKDQGYALVSIDYRLAPETKLPELISDIEAAFAWLGGEGSKRFQLDPSRMVVAGGSAGGYLTLVTGYRVKPKPVALVALYGYGTLTSPWYATPSPHLRHNPKEITREQAEKQTDGTIISDARERIGNGAMIYLHYRQRGIWPKEVSGFSEETIDQQIVAYEPARNVSADYPPTLMIHGTRDTDVPFEESSGMHEQLMKHGVRAILKPIDNGEHGFSGGNAKQINEAYASMRGFIIEHLKEASSSPGADAE